LACWSLYFQRPQALPDPVAGRIRKAGIRFINTRLGVVPGAAVVSPCFLESNRGLNPPSGKTKTPRGETPL